MTDWRVDENLQHLLEELAYFKQRITELVLEKHIYKRDMIRFDGWNRQEYDRVCRALKFHRQNYRIICERIHSTIPYR